jgi:hypothetical protein
MSDSSDAKAEGQPRDVQVVTIGPGSPYPAELIDPIHAATSTRKLFRLVPEYELHDPDGELKGYRRRLMILLTERFWTLRLLACTPFRDLPENKIRDVRTTDPKHKKRIPKARQVLPCPERRGLLSSLAGVLAFWKTAQASNAWRYFAADRDQGLAIHQKWIALLTEHQRRRMPFVDQTIRPRALLKAIQYVSNEISKMQPADVEALGPVKPDALDRAMPGAPLYDTDELTVRAVQMMFEDFRFFGPREFPRDAIYYAVAAILNGVGVPSIRGKRFTAAGIQRLLVRQPPEPYMSPGDAR